MIFDILPYSNGDGGTKIFLADPVKERNPLRYTFKVIKFCLLGSLWILIFKIKNG